MTQSQTQTQTQTRNRPIRDPWRRGASLGALMLLSTALVTQGTQAACPATPLVTVKDGATQRLIRKGPGFVQWRAGLRVNTDGAPNSYHPIGTEAGALSSICNGIAVMPNAGPYAGKRVTAKASTKAESNARCQIILDIFRASLKAGYAVPATGKIDWYAIAQDPKAAKDGKYHPCVQADGPFKDFFVSTTALVADNSKSDCDPAHWVDSTRIPYVTLPAKVPQLTAAGVEKGNLALVHRQTAAGATWVTAIIADTGNSDELGEGSLALHAALGNPMPAINKPPFGIGDGVTTILFPGKFLPGPITAAALSDAALRTELIARAGGQAVLDACLAE